MAQWLALSLDRRKVLGLNPVWEFLCGVCVGLLVSAWVLSVHSGFLRSLDCDSKLAIGVNMSTVVCVSLATDWRLIQEGLCLLPWDRLKLSCALKSDKQKKMNGLKRKKKSLWKKKICILRPHWFKPVYSRSVSLERLLPKPSPHRIHWISWIELFASVKFPAPREMMLLRFVKDFCPCMTLQNAATTSLVWRLCIMELWHRHSGFLTLSQQTKAQLSLCKIPLLEDYWSGTSCSIRTKSGT